ncbi:MAG: hypothetical protein KDA81_09570 [Planctomycetaceae bacterium]|nr:hypothetical protein [Planctomycetaceae bacterium]
MQEPISETSFQRSLLLRRLAILLGICAALGFVLVFPFPVDGQLWGALFDLAHAPAFFIVTLLCAGVLDPPAIGLSSRWRSVIRLSRSHVLLIVCCLMVVGVVGEFAQSLVGRSTSLHDVVANGIGSGAALLWIIGVAVGGRSRRVLSFTAILALVVANIEPVQNVMARVRQLKEFPVLASFEDSGELGNWLSHQAKMVIDSSWASAGSHSGRVTLYPARYPGVILDWFHRDWSEFRRLQFDIRNCESIDLTLTLKIFDQAHRSSGMSHEDRYHREIKVAAGQETHIEIELSDLKTAPQGREMDLRKVAVLELFGSNLTRPTEFQIDDFRLTR